MNQITKKEYPALFENIEDAIIEDSSEDHRRGSNFFVTSIVEFRLEYSVYYPSIDLTPFVGTWETNVYIRDTEHGTDFNEINTLTRVELKEVVTTTKVWEPVK